MDVVKTPKELKQGMEISRLRGELTKTRQELDSVIRTNDKLDKSLTHFMNRNTEIWTAVFYSKTLEDAQKRLKRV